jgi:hypothetical protein
MRRTMSSILGILNRMAGGLYRNSQTMIPFTSLSEVIRDWCFLSINSHFRKVFAGTFSFNFLLW